MIPVGVGLHQGSSLSPYLFAMIMDVLARGIKDISPWCMLYADDIVLCGTRSEVVEKKLEEWRRAMEDRGLKKTVYLRFNVDRGLDDGNSDVRIRIRIILFWQHTTYRNSNVYKTIAYMPTWRLLLRPFLVAIIGPPEK